MRLFDSHILPISDYGSEIWYSGHRIHDLEYVQLWFIKTTLGIKIQSSNLISYGDTGRFPLIYRQQDFALKYLDRLRNTNPSKPLHHVYLELRKLHEKGNTNWYSKIIGILKSSSDISIQSGRFTKNGEEVESLYKSTKDMRYNSFINHFFTSINDC